MFRQKIIAHNKSIQCLELLNMNETQYVVSCSSGEIKVWEVEVCPGAVLLGVNSL